ncbi:MAG TPA: hypothetical protein VN493_14605 [Thermoanaerobaculia bacterium]|nr:hypothetical protein [Thermoanaerobaculia bacterium]
MPRSSLYRTAAILIVAVLLAVPVSADPLSRLWAWLSASWSDIGCGIDPDGRCRRPGTQGEIGCIIDPNGGCRQ